MHHRLLPDGRRLHLGHGQIDLIVQDLTPDSDLGARLVGRVPMAIKNHEISNGKVVNV